MTYQRTPSSDGNALAARTSIAKLERTATSVRRLESSLKMSTSPRLREELWNKKELQRLVTSSKLKMVRLLESPEEIESLNSRSTTMLSTTEATRERPMVTRRRERSETGPAKAASTKTSPSDKTATIAGCPKTKACRFCTVRTNNRWICTPSLVKCRVRCINNLVCSILNRPSSNLCLNNLLLSNNLVNINNFETTSLSVHKSWTGYMFKSLYFKIKLTISFHKPFFLPLFLLRPSELLFCSFGLR